MTGSKLRRLLWTLRSAVVRRRQEQDLDDELRFHLEAEAEERMAEGMTPEEARLQAARSLGNPTAVREQTRTVWTWHPAEQLASDVRFGSRQLRRTKIGSGAAILSLALAIGACVGAFRLIDALLLRPLPVEGAEQLHVVVRKGQTPDRKPNIYDSCAYPMFQLMRSAARGQAELIAVWYPERVDVTYGADSDMEKAYRQYASGHMFATFGLKPALGRLLTEADDRTPGGHPYAVISYDYWTRRFARDAGVLGRTMRMGETLYEIVGVVEPKFTGTDPGTMVDFYLPVMMNRSVLDRNSSSARTLVRLEPGANREALQQKLHGIMYAFEKERAQGFTGLGTAWMRTWFEHERLVLEPARSGVSGMQRAYREALIALSVLVGLVLLIACVNVANLMMARSIARAREMALRVSIGAGRLRLIQLVLVESAWIAFLAAALGSLFASVAAPLVVALINPPNNPARLELPMDWRVLAFSIGLTFVVTFLFGLAPALRASGVKPSSALKGGEDPHARKRLMHSLVAVQVGFCVLVLFLGGLFVSTYERLKDQPTGFSADRVLVLETVAAGKKAPAAWDEVAAALRQTPGVEKVAMLDRPLMSGGSWNGFISVNGAAPKETLAFYRLVSPGLLDAMQIRLVDGRDFLPDDVEPRAAIVNETFVQTYFGGEPRVVGKSFRTNASGPATEIVGVMRDSRYKNAKDPILPVAYFPMLALEKDGALRSSNAATFVVKTAGPNPAALADLLRKRVAQARPEFRVANIRTQQEIVEAHSVRERLLAMLAVFFAGVALVLAGVGLFGVLDHSVLQKRREIGIRMALGAKPWNVVRRVTSDVMKLVLAGVAVGIGCGLASEQYVSKLLYGVKVTDPVAVAAPTIVLLVVAMLAAVPPVMRAVRTNPAHMLRTD
jgi:predicted permease